MVSRLMHEQRPRPRSPSAATSFVERSDGAVRAVDERTAHAAEPVAECGGWT